MFISRGDIRWLFDFIAGITGKSHIRKTYEVKTSFGLGRRDVGNADSRMHMI